MKPIPSKAEVDHEIGVRRVSTEITNIIHAIEGETDIPEADRLLDELQDRHPRFPDRDRLFDASHEMVRRVAHAVQPKDL